MSDNRANMEDRARPIMAYVAELQAKVLALQDEVKFLTKENNVQLMKMAAWLLMKDWKIVVGIYFVGMIVGSVVCYVCMR